LIHTPRSRQRSGRNTKPSRPAINSDVPPKAERRPSDRRLRKQASRAQPLCDSKAAVTPTAALRSKAARGALPKLASSTDFETRPGKHKTHTRPDRSSFGFRQSDCRSSVVWLSPND